MHPIWQSTCQYMTLWVRNVAMHVSSAASHSCVRPVYVNTLRRNILLDRSRSCAHTVTAAMHSGVHWRVTCADTRLSDHSLAGLVEQALNIVQTFRSISRLANVLMMIDLFLCALFSLPSVLVICCMLPMLV